MNAIAVFLTGAIDSMSWIAFYLNLDVTTYYNLAIFVKLFLCFFLIFIPFELSKTYKTLALGICCLICALISLSLMSSDLFKPMFKMTGFFASLLITCSLLSKETYKMYWKGVLASLVFCLGLFATSLISGRLLTVFGRYSFFNESHPNLGGEYFAAGALASILAIRNSLIASIVALIFFAGSTLLQARAAMLTIILLAFFSLASRFQVRSFSLPGAILTFFLLGLLYNIDFAKEIFMVTNEGRGLDSGFSGRTNIYNEAFTAFKENPISGLGFGYFDNVKRPAVHNFFLQGFAEFGLMYIFILSLLLYYLYLLSKNSTQEFFLVLLFLPLILFNARFINLNPFPFLIYVLLCKKI